MRIVTVGDASEDDAPPALTEDDVEPVSAERRRMSPPPKPTSSPQAAPEILPDPTLPDTHEIFDTEDVPDSAERISVEVADEPPPPPPPPRRKPPRPKKDAKPKAGGPPVESRKRQRPWWEELYGDDFNRSHFRLADGQIHQETTFIEASLGVAKGGVILDLACGAGYHAVELASRGYGVVGYDLSLAQLALAADVAQERDQKINFLQGDMREMAFEEMFDGVYCWNTSFGYFEEEKNISVAQRIFRALRPGGMFLLDVANRDFVVADQPSAVWYEGDSCVCMDDMWVDFITSRLKVKRTIMLEDGRTLECNYSVRLYGLHELGKLLHDVGFRVTEASGHPATPGVFFGSSSPRIIILAERPE